MEHIPNIEENKIEYDKFVSAYNEVREHGGINGLTPSEMFLQKLIILNVHRRNKQHGVTHVGN